MNIADTITGDTLIAIVIRSYNGFDVPVMSHHVSTLGSVESCHLHILTVYVQCAA
jgi:hypothetical protein